MDTWQFFYFYFFSNDGPPDMWFSSGQSQSGIFGAVTRFPLKRTRKDFGENSARARARVCMYVCVAFHSMKRNTPLLSLKPLKKVWLYLKAWPGRETQTTVCSNISRQAADYYEFYYCLGSDVFQEETLIKRFTLLCAVGGKKISVTTEWRH